MYDEHKNKMNVFAVLVIGCCVLTGCLGGNSNPVRFYLVNPVEFNQESSSSGEQLAIEIINLRVPEYLERSHIASRSGENRLLFSEFNQWGENLRKNLMRTMAVNLSRILSTPDISTPLNRTSSIPDYRLEIHVDQFGRDSDGLVKLYARWQLIHPAESTPLGIRRADLASEIQVDEQDYDRMVSEMRDLYGELSRMIAESIFEEEKDN